MSRTIPANAQTELAKKFGTEPINIVEIEWVEGDEFSSYSDKSVGNIPGKILQLSNLDEVINISGSSVSAQISIVLDDTDGTIKTLIDNYDVHKRPCRIYQYFDGLSLDDKFLIFSGEINSPIVWQNETKEVSFDILSEIESNEVGFTPEEGQYSFIPNDLVGKSWPLVFGSCVHVPCTKANQQKTGSNASYFGLADALLDHKIKYIETIQEQLKTAYNFYYLIVQVANSSNNDPITLQELYIDAIKTEDLLKQSVEDQTENIKLLNKQLDQLIKVWHAQENNSDKNQILDKINAVRVARNDRVSTTKNNYNKLRDLDFNKKTYEKQKDYSEYVFQLKKDVRDIMVSLLDNYLELEEAKVEIGKAITSQAAFFGNDTVLIIDGNDFPQNQQILLESNGAVFKGSFSGKKFSVSAVLPTNSNILLAAPQDNDLDAIWLPNTDIDLTNQYCLMNNGNIIKITSQEGTKATFDLIQKKDDNRSRENDVVVNDQNASEITQAINNLLTGNETIAQINTIINQIPRDISKTAWDRLTNNKGNEQHLLLGGDVDGGSFKIIYNGETTGLIAWDATAKEIHEKFLDDMTFFKFGVGETDKLEVVGGKNEDENGKLNEKDSDGNFYPVIFRFKPEAWLDDDDPVPAYMYAMSTDSSLLSTNTTTPSVAEIDTEFAKGSNVVTVGSFSDVDPKEGDIVEIGGINYTVESFVTNLILKEPLQARVLVGDSVTIVPENPTKLASVTAYRPLDGASEYTLKERTKMIEEELEKDYNYLALIEAKENIVKLNKYKSQTNNQDELKKISQMLEGNLSRYNDLKTSLEQLPITVLDEAYRLINDNEYRFLFSTELLNYLHWRLDRTSILQDLEDETPEYYFTNADFTSILETSSTILPHWVSTMLAKTGTDFLEQFAQLPQNEALVIDIGSEFRLFTNYQEKWIANILPSTVHGVYAKRNINGLQQLFPVSSDRYIKNESDDYGLFNATSITLKKPLKDYKNEDWIGNDLFVTLTSTVGPNTSDIIKWLLETYTNVTVDATSFASVKTSLTNYPSHFGLFRKEDALSICKNIAWQARCNLSVRNGTAYLLYLPTEASSVANLNETNIADDNLELSFTDTEDIVTKFVANWRASYDISESNKLILRHNVKKYGEFEKEYDFFIYNIRDLVLKSATFWTIRKANSWKHAKFSVFLDNLKLQTLDTITINLTSNPFASSDIKGVIDKAIYNSVENRIDLDIWLPVKAGSMTKYDFAWPADVAAEDIFPEIDLIVAGNAGNVINAQVPSGAAYDPNDSSALRPFDYGQINPSDLNDSLPDNPANEFKELEYKAIKPSTNTPVVKNSFQGNVPPGNFDQTAAKLENDRKLNSHVQGGEPNFTGIGRVVSFDSLKNITLPDDADPDETDVHEQYYNVQLSNGQTKKVRQVLIREEDRIPPGTVVYVTWDTHHQELVMQVPVWVGDDVGSV